MSLIQTTFYSASYLFKVFVVVVIQSLSHVQLFATPWTAACQASCPSLFPRVCSNSCPLSRWCHPTISSSNHPFSLWPLIFPSIRAFSNEWALHIKWPEYWTFKSVLPMNIQGWFPLGLTGLISLQSRGLSRVLSKTTVQKHQFFGIQASLWFTSHSYTWLLEKP